MDATLIATCTTCPGALALKHAAINEGYVVTMETVKHSDARTERSAQLGIGLPVLIDNETGAMSDDAKTWIPGGKKKLTKVTHPLDEVIVDAN